MMNDPVKKAIESYFRGGNAKDIKDSRELRLMLETIKSFILEKEQEEVQEERKKLYNIN